MPEIFGHHDGEPVYEVELATAAGARARIITWGAVVRDLLVPVAEGRVQRVVLGLSSLADYVAHSPHFGSIEGRYGNRVAQGRFTLAGVSHELPRNEAGRHSLHGGGRAFGQRIWQLVDSDPGSVTLRLVSPDGDNGYPGTLTATCIYRLIEPATLRIELAATTDRATPVNLCHHSYFNLDGAETIAGHRLTVAADFYTPNDAELIPTGEIRTVAGTPYDFRTGRPLLDEPDRPPAGYDVNFVLRKPFGAPDALVHAARVESTGGPVTLDLHTSEPGLQVYDGAKCAVAVTGLDGRRSGAHAGLCLEPQRFPDSPNRPHFPGGVLRPGEVYRQVTEYRFG
jgi:aldose 1-epimerase